MQLRLSLITQDRQKDIYNNLNHPYIAIDVPGHGDSNFHVSSDSYSINDFSSDLLIAIKPPVNMINLPLIGVFLVIDL